MNLLIILVVLFATLFALTTFLEGKAKPLTPEQQQQLGQWILIAVAVSLVLGLIRMLF